MWIKNTAKRKTSTEYKDAYVVVTVVGPVNKMEIEVEVTPARGKTSLHYFPLGTQIVLSDKEI